jgi:hypothetical protein
MPNDIVKLIIMKIIVQRMLNHPACIWMLTPVLKKCNTEQAGLYIFALIVVHSQ